MITDTGTHNSMNNNPSRFTSKRGNLHIQASLVPWDTEIFDFPVAQIDLIKLASETLASEAFAEFERWRDEAGVCFVSCRLPHNRLHESFFLEEHGFRFIEMVIQPELDLTTKIPPSDNGIQIYKAADTDLIELENIATVAFGSDRFHMDPRIDHGFGDQRYRMWVRTCFSLPSQQLLKVTNGDHIVGFFIIEKKLDNSCYWHLTAIAPGFQGRGIGRQVWLAMIQHLRAEGIERILTTIAVRNIRVLNLYTWLGFRFHSPQMTFHWLCGHADPRSKM